MSTAILIIIEGSETAFNGFWYQFTTGKPLKNMKQTPNYYENSCTYINVTANPTQNNWLPLSAFNGFQYQFTAIHIYTSYIHTHTCWKTVETMITDVNYSEIGSNWLLISELIISFKKSLNGGREMHEKNWTD